MMEYKEILCIENLTKNFGGVKALNAYSLSLSEGRLMGLIGPNGAGKTTVFNIITGVLRPTSGRIRFKGEDVTHLRVDKRVAWGIARTFQNIRLFKALSVLDNVKVGFHFHQGSAFWATLLNLPSFRKNEREIEEQSYALLEIFGLQAKCCEVADNLPYGEQRKVELARALATHPRLLLLDEPAAGMNPRETDEIIEIISKIHKEYRLTI
ncbi:MAG: ABC transporter ATP-binding protein, partial [Nitrospira sp.]|nr:ABC transporter ATP-binding protein [Nitrospira sp.]